MSRTRDQLRHGLMTWKQVVANLFLVNRNAMVRQAYGAAGFGRVIRRMFLTSVKFCFQWWVQVLRSGLKHRLEQAQGDGRDFAIKTILQGWQKGSLVSGFSAFKYLLNSREVRYRIEKLEGKLYQHRIKVSS